MFLVLEHSGERTILVPTLRELQVWWSERHQPGVLQMTSNYKVMCVIKEKRAEATARRGAALELRPEGSSGRKRGGGGVSGRMHGR